MLSPLEKPRDANLAGFELGLKEDLPASPIEKNFVSPIAPLQENQASVNALSPPLESGCSGTEQKKPQVPIKIPKKLNKVSSSDLKGATLLKYGNEVKRNCSRFILESQNSVFQSPLDQFSKRKKASVQKSITPSRIRLLKLTLCLRFSTKKTPKQKADPSRVSAAALSNSRKTTQREKRKEN